MSADSLSAESIANFLKENPSFFREHADIFSELRVPHPNETRAISLGERQIMTLRARTKDLEWKLSGLVQNASGNERISKTLTDWCCRMLAEDDCQQIPAHIVRSLSDMFDLPAVALRLWDVPKLTNSEFTEDVTEAVREQARGLTKPYCGPALIALRPDGQAEPLGLLVLGSSDPEHFSLDMGTMFLETINRLASASLTRLRLPDTPPTAA
jgi:uncharacterized protein YigA (DUF484 family)